MSEKIMLTGIKPTGYPHLGNYIGAIKPALQMSKKNEGKALYFIPFGKKTPSDLCYR